MPLVQKLHDKLQGRSDVLFVTMNVDEDQKKVQPLVQQKRYTFPVLFAYKYVRVTLATKGIPRNWVIDRDGVFRVDEIGYHGPADRWLEEMSRHVEQTPSR